LSYFILTTHIYGKADVSPEVYMYVYTLRCTTEIVTIIRAKFKSKHRNCLFEIQSHVLWWFIRNSAYFPCV